MKLNMMQVETQKQQQKKAREKAHEARRGVSPAPKRVFGIGNDIKVGEKANLTVFDLNKKYTIKTSELISMGKATPFEGNEVFGRCMLTICKGDIVWKENLTEN